MTTGAQILVGDALEHLRALPDRSVQCCVTSPPYWGLRDYGTGTWEGGDPACAHKGRVLASGKSRLRVDDGHDVVPATEKKRTANVPLREACRCGARRVDRQLGLERTPDEYVARLVELFREVRRVLRDDGTLWLNLGDTYTDGGRGADVGSTLEGTRHNQAESRKATNRQTFKDLRPKNLVGVPWRVAFALQADGWYLRSDIVWAKPNPMPESVKDRPTKAHEYVFLLAKSEAYFYDYDGVAEPVAPSQVGRVRDDAIGGTSWQERGQHSEGGRYGSGNKERKLGDQRGRPDSHIGGSIPWEDLTGKRNARSVWTITTKPFPGAHFAVMPVELAQRCIRAGTKPGDLVLDPFGGAGTTGLAAVGLARRALLIELSPEFAKMASERIDSPLFTQPQED